MQRLLRYNQANITINLTSIYYEVHGGSMSYLTISRILFFALWVNEIVVVARSTPEERASMNFPRWLPIMILLLFVPLLWPLDLPPWLALIAIVLQAVGLVVELAGEVQLSRAHSFSIAARPPEQPQREGLYRFLENPIYVAILMQFFGWALWNPVAFISVALQLVMFRRMVSAERVQLASLSFMHRKLDSALWN
jgi:protein-S-isoprenylcysteine O-methyltransferase Ste14